MNWVDAVIILLLVYFGFEGFGRSFIIESVDLISFCLALVFSLKFFSFLAQILEKNLQVAHSLANVVGFFLVWAGVEIALSFIVGFFLKRFMVLSFIDSKLRHLAVVPAFIRGLIFIAMILVLVATFPIQPQIKIAVSNSKIGSAILSKAYQLEAPLQSVFGGITNDTLTFLTVEPQTNESVDLGFKTTNFKPREDLEFQMIDLVNKERTSRGIKALTYDPKLRLPARDHSADMFTRGYFSHYSPEGKTVADRAAQYGIDYEVIGENLAYAPSLELAHNGLMNSPGHRANILSTDYTKVGIGIEDGGPYGLMITQVFTN